MMTWIFRVPCSRIAQVCRRIQACLRGLLSATGEGSRGKIQGRASFASSGIVVRVILAGERTHSLENAYMPSNMKQ